MNPPSNPKIRRLLLKLSGLLPSRLEEKLLDYLYPSGCSLYFPQEVPAR